LNKGHILYII